jgi:hypothetical protein
MEDVNVSNVREMWAGCRKGDLPLLSSLRVVIHSSCQKGLHDKADGKKKSDGEAKKKHRIGLRAE